MRNIYTTINEYYEAFESYSGVVTIKSKLTWVTLLALVMSIFTCLWFVELFQIDMLVFERSFRFIIMIVMFVLTLVCITALVSARDKKVIERLQRALVTKEIKLWRLRELWLDKYLPYKRYEYLELAECIDKSSSLREKYRDISDLSIRELGEYIFANDSKARVLAMFLMLAATIGTLSIRGENGATLESIFMFYSTASTKELFTIFVFFPIVIFIAFIQLKIIAAGLVRLIERLFEKMNGSSAYSKRRAKIFINVLVRHVAFEKPKINVAKLDRQKEKMSG